MHVRRRCGRVRQGTAQDGCYLPATGWGRLTLPRSRPQSNQGWTDSGEGFDDRGLKHRADNDTRSVPIPPELVTILQYHQENADPASRDMARANRGLMRCIADRVPVGVLREQAPARHHTRYDVLGLALPVTWEDGRFYFESLSPKAVPVIDPVSDVLEAMARAEVDQELVAESGTLDDDYDARRRIYREIVARQGQAGFRAALLGAYGGRCAITGFDAAPALEGAHLRPYRGPESNVVTNGLLLRSDIHMLFDLRLLAVDPVTRTIVLSKLLAGTQYEALSSSQLAEPTEAWQRPDQEALESKWQALASPGLRMSNRAALFLFSSQHSD